MYMYSYGEGEERGGEGGETEGGREEDRERWVEVRRGVRKEWRMYKLTCQLQKRDHPSQ